MSSSTSPPASPPPMSPPTSPPAMSSPASPPCQPTPTDTDAAAVSSPASPPTWPPTSPTWPPASPPQQPVPTNTDAAQPHPSETSGETDPGANVSSVSGVSLQMLQIALAPVESNNNFTRLRLVGSLTRLLSWNVNFDLQAAENLVVYANAMWFHGSVPGLDAPTLVALADGLRNNILDEALSRTRIHAEWCRPFIEVFCQYYHQVQPEDDEARDTIIRLAWKAVEPLLKLVSEDEDEDETTPN
ncbi:hypothetical protein ACHAPT_009196 [Fusarium lateritium]